MKKTAVLPYLLVGLISAATAMAAPTTFIDPNGNYLEPLLEGGAQFKAIAFKNALPNPLVPGYVYIPGSDEPGPNSLPPDPNAAPGYDWYEISMREVGHHNAQLVDDSTGQLLPPFTVRAYGNRYPMTPPYSNSYPGPTIEARQGRPIKVEWYNELSTPFFLPVDKTIMCGPEGFLQAWQCPEDAAVVHVHGSHGYDHSDGLPDQWFTPFVNGKPRVNGELWDQNQWLEPVETRVSPATVNEYPVDQEAATLWYHDHAEGITRLNAMAGLAGFFLVRDNNELAMQTSNPPGIPAYPYEVPIAIQDHMFWGATVPRTKAVLGGMAIPDAPLLDCSTGTCQPVLINEEPTPTIIPEFFGNIPLVNGVAWPKLDVEPRKYRVRFLNASDSRTYVLQLALPGNITTLTPPTPSGDPITIIGNEQGFLNAPVNVQQLVIMPGMRFDCIIDFAKYAGTNQQLILQNVGGDVPYNGTIPSAATPGYTPTDPFGGMGQIMAFNVTLAMNAMIAPATVADAVLPANLRALSTSGGYPDVPVVPAGTEVVKSFLKEIVEPYGRVQLTIDFKQFADAITQLPPLGSTQIWEIANLTPDAHPMHLHLVKFRIVNREQIASVNGVAPFAPAVPAPLPQPKPVYRGTGVTNPARAYESGYLDTVECPPGQMTRIIATFDIPGVYVWHCHILHHEEFDMMREFAVLTPARGVNVTSTTPSLTQTAGSATTVSFTADAQTGISGMLPGTGVAAPASTLAYEYRFWVRDPARGGWYIAQNYSRTKTFRWTPPTVPGTYPMQVDARSIGSTASREAKANFVYTLSGNIPTSLTLAATPPSPQPAGTASVVAFTATASPAGSYQYRFWVRDPSGVWSAPTTYGSSNTFTWTPPATPGSYYIQADVRVPGSNVQRNALSVIRYVLSGSVPATITTTATPASPQQAGTQVAINAGTSSSGSFEYRFWIRDPVRGWSVLQSYSSSSSATWTPTTSGTYTYQVDIRPAGSFVSRTSSVSQQYVVQ